MKFILEPLFIGDVAPDFEQESTHGPIQFHEWAQGHWVVLFSHPKDFTPVCTTELGLVARLTPEFEKRGVKVLGLSVDSVEEHKEWSKDIEDIQGCQVSFPILADSDCRVAKLYNMVHINSQETLTVRSVYIIDPNKKIRLMLTYPISAGRNFNEILRVIDSLQLSDVAKVMTPGNWEPGGDVIISEDLQDEDEIQMLFPQGYRAVKPYLRVTPQPEKK